MRIPGPPCGKEEEEKEEEEEGEQEEEEEKAQDKSPKRGASTEGLYW